jgi:hypothetical protein
VSQGPESNRPTACAGWLTGVTDQNAGTDLAFVHRQLVEVANLLVGSLLAGTDVPEVGALPDDGTGLPVGSGPDTSPTRSPHAGKGPPT